MKADRSELQSAPHFTRPANSPATLSAGRQRLRFQCCVIFELRPRERVTPFHSTTLAPVDKDLQAVRVEAEVSVQGRSRRSGHGLTTFSATNFFSILCLLVIGQPPPHFGTT